MLRVSRSTGLSCFHVYFAFGLGYYYISKKVKRMKDIRESMFSLFDSFLYFSLSPSLWRHGSFVFEFHLSQEHFPSFHTTIETIHDKLNQFSGKRFIFFANIISFIHPFPLVLKIFKYWTKNNIPRNLKEIWLLSLIELIWFFSSHKNLSTISINFFLLEFFIAYEN